MIKVIVTGSNGLLGQTLVNLLSKLNYKIYAFSRGKDKNITTTSQTYYNIDLTNFDDVKNKIKKIKPNFIVNAAAMTHVDICEENKEECDIINVELVKHLVLVCKEIKSHLIHISTDFIFDGKNGPYSEDDKPNPINYYGLSKLKSEQVLFDSSIDYTILRTILVYGYVKGLSRNNIVLWIKESLEKEEEVTIIDDQFRMPTLVNDLANACLLVIQKKAKGVFNISSNQLLSIYDMAISVAEVFGLDKKLIKKITTRELNQVANRPVKTGFDLSKAKTELNLPIFSFEERLQYFKDQLYKLE